MLQAKRNLQYARKSNKKCFLICVSIYGDSVSLGEGEGECYRSIMQKTSHTFSLELSRVTLGGAAYNKRRPQPFNLELFATRVAHQFYKFGRWKYAERQVRRVVVSVRSNGVCEL